MNDQEAPHVFFDQQAASSYDEKWAKLAPTRDALHLLIRVILSDLPEEANVLCVGAGTGSELIDLAQNFPQWRFTAVEPSAPMLEVCRRRAEENGITSRCVFHEGYLDSLPASDPFDAATSLLVSHFIMRKEERGRFFNQIALRLRPNGYLISSDIAYDMAASSFQSLGHVWWQMMRHSNVNLDIEKMYATFGRDVAVLPPPEVAAIIESSGFEPPVLFSQSLLIHAWYTRRALPE